MKPSDALEWIRTTFIKPEATNQLAGSIPEEQFLSALEAIEKRLPYSSGPTGNSIQMFLYCGCIKFDRWLPPSPYVMPAEHKKRFDCFLQAMRLGSPDPNNSARFQADQIKWELVEFLHERSMQKLQGKITVLAGFEERLRHITPPILPVKQEEYQKVVGDCIALIEAARQGQLRTIVSTQIPIVPVLSALTIKTVWRDIPTMLSLSPTFFTPKNNMINVEGDLVMTPLTPSQWQHGFCEVGIEWEALLDQAMPSRPLSLNLPIGAPVDAWPQIFTDVFDVLDRVIWKLRLQQESLNSDILQPSDLAPIEWQVFAGDQKIDWVKKGQPGTAFRITNQKEPVASIEVDITKPIHWHTKCYTLAEANLAKGKTKEAVFWINVATEALFEKRSQEICEQFDLDYEELSSGKCYWDNADEIVKRDLPDHSHEVKWPEASIGNPSWFAKIKYLSKRASLIKSLNELFAQYEKIQRHRNALFHGDGDENVSAEEAEVALKAFLWLEENF